MTLGKRADVHESKACLRFQQLEAGNATCGQAQIQFIADDIPYP